MEYGHLEPLHDVDDQLWTPADKKDDNNHQKHLDYLQPKHQKLFRT